MLKSRVMFGVLALVLALSLAQSGYAQLQLSATSNPNGTETANKVTGFTNDPTVFVGMTITGTVMSDAPITGGRLRITYPAAVTNACFTADNNVLSATNTPGRIGAGVGATSAGGATNVPVPNWRASTICGAAFDQPAADPVQVTFASGIFTGATVVTVDAVNGRVDVSLPCLANQAGGGATASITNQTGTIIIHGVRIDASSITTFPANATLSLVSGFGIPGIANVGGAGGAGAGGAVPLSICGTGTGAGPAGFPATNGTQANLQNVITSAAPANILLPATTSVPVINASSAGISSVTSGGIPASVSTPADVLAVPTAATHAPPTGLADPAGACTGTDIFHTSCGVATVNTNRNIPQPRATFTVKEGFSAAWYRGDSTFSNLPGAAETTNAAFSLTFNGLPAGVTLALAVQDFTSTVSPIGCPAAIATPTLSNATITTANNTTNVAWNNCLSTSSTDYVTFTVSASTNLTSGTIPAGTVTVSGNMIPVGAALDLTTSTVGPSALNVYPRYTSVAVGNATVVNIQSASTTMLVPFAVTLAAANINTGIAIANTSVDPFATGGAIANSGPIQFNFYATSGTGVASTASFTTSTTKNPGGGLSADGTLAPGATMAVNLSNLLTLAGVTGDFSGYIFIQASFLPAHGAAFVYNPVGGNSTQYTAYGAVPVFVLPNPSTNSRTTEVGLHF